MSLISKKLEELRLRNEAALIPYIMAGDPDIETTAELVLEMEKAGADMIELGVPFSDPLADGPTIQRAAARALGRKVNVKKIFLLVRKLRENTRIPVILMLYFNLVHKYGQERFVADAAAAGVDGLIIPDLPPEEASVLMKASAKSALDIIFLLAPTSSVDRIKLADTSSSGFIYYVSLTGVTGARASLDAGISQSLKRIRRYTKKPICVGFGISMPQQAREMAKVADGVIVGSAIVGLIEKAGSRESAVTQVGAFVKELKAACISVR
ncbi:MAG: tryptophan synthase subunit alpha [Nitrospirota bacterium]